MIQDLDHILKKLLKGQAEDGSDLKSAKICFDLPDSEWRKTVQEPTVNCYLYDIRENKGMNTNEPLMIRSVDKRKAARVRPPKRIDCAYCITAWSKANEESQLLEHRLLSQVLIVLLNNSTIPKILLEGTLLNQIPPYPTIIASQDSIRSKPEFWEALDQQLKPSLNYVITLAVLLNDIPKDDDMTQTPEKLKIDLSAGEWDETYERDIS